MKDPAPQPQVVSFDSESLILVDRDDTEIGTLSKRDCHNGEGVLHRAFSAFIFNADDELLLQKRAQDKRLWPGFWSNSCCSHPRRGESMAIATTRRLRDELNVEAELEYVYKFAYQADYGDAGAENELCHVFSDASPTTCRPMPAKSMRCALLARHSSRRNLRPAGHHSRRGFFWSGKRCARNTPAY